MGSTALELSPSLTAGTGRRGRLQQEDWPEHSPWLRSTSTLGTVLQSPEKGACTGAALFAVGSSCCSAASGRHRDGLCHTGDWAEE